MGINSAADNAFNNDSDSPVTSANMNYVVSADGKMPTINTVSDADVGMTPGLSGQQAEPTVKTIDLPDSDETKIRSAV